MNIHRHKALDIQAAQYGMRCLLTGAVLFILVGACTNNSLSHDPATYTCPMHPTVVSDEPGTCPVCGMDLVRKSRQGDNMEIPADVAALLESPADAVVARLRVVKGEYKSVPLEVSAAGVVTYNTREIYTLPARVGGRLEKVYIRYAFQQIAKGQKIAEIYSPELVAAQRELLFLLERDAKNLSLIDAAKQKLQLLGMSGSQIDAVIRRGEATNIVAVYSAYSGYIITGQSVPAPGSQPSEATAPFVREGDYVAQGETLFTIVKNDALRIDLELPGIYADRIVKGQKAELLFDTHERQLLTVDFVQPYYHEREKFLKVRVYPDHSKDLLIGQLINARILIHSAEGLWVPREAVWSLGLRKVVFIRDRGLFKPKNVTTGLSVGGMVIIESGLASTDEIASNAQFLVDSDSFIKPSN